MRSSALLGVGLLVVSLVTAHSGNEAATLSGGVKFVRGDDCTKR